MTGRVGGTTAPTKSTQSDGAPFASAVAGKQQAAANASHEHTLDSVSGQNVFGDFRPSDLLDTATMLIERAALQPQALGQAALDFWSEMLKIANGKSALQPEPGDRRFSDAAWNDNRLYFGLLQGYLALRRSMLLYAQTSGLEGQEAERAEFLIQQISDAIAPTNYLLGNPAALRRAVETRGESLLRGAKNLADDIANRRPIPSQTDEKAFEVGRNLAATSGAVVFRHEMFELIQYAPQTSQVWERPILTVPSIINKYYVFDLAPGRSLFEYFVKQGFSVFTIVWRNPRPEHDGWGLVQYQDAIDAAVDAVREITGVDAVNMWALCGAAPVATPLLAHYAAIDQHKVHSLMLIVAPLDMHALTTASTIGALMEQAAMPLVKNDNRKKRMSANEFKLMFAMLRANDLIWNYWVSDYLMGDTPAPFDVLYWNADGTGMTAQFNHDFGRLTEENPLVTPGRMIVRGQPIADLADLGIDSYIVGAQKDHLCVWQGVYRCAQLLGKRSQFVLGNSGHIQTIVSPPGNQKAAFWTNPALPATPEEWLEGATKHPGSWWDHFAAWTTTQSGRMVDAPAAPGSAKHPPLCPAPGTYIYERAS